MMQIGQTDVATRHRCFHVALTEILQARENCDKFFVRKIEGRIVCRRHGSESDLGKTQNAREMLEDSGDFGGASSKRHAGPHRPRVSLDQPSGLLGDDRVAATTSRRVTVAIVNLCGTIHAERHTDSAVDQKVGRGTAEKRAICGQGEVDELAGAGLLPSRVSHDLSYELQIGQRFAPEEGDVHDFRTAALGKQQIDRASGGRDRHTAASPGIDQIFLVAIGAREIAAGIDREDEGIETSFTRTREKGRVCGLRPEEFQGAKLLEDLATWAISVCKKCADGRGRRGIELEDRAARGVEEQLSAVYFQAMKIRGREGCRMQSQSPRASSRCAYGQRL